MQLLTDSQVWEILDSREPHSTLAARYGVSLCTIKSVSCGKHRKDLYRRWFELNGPRPRPRRLSREAVFEVLSDPGPLAPISKRLGVSQSLLSQIRRGTQYSDWYWEYVDLHGPPSVKIKPYRPRRPKPKTHTPLARTGARRLALCQRWSTNV